MKTILVLVSLAAATIASAETCSTWCTSYNPDGSCRLRERQCTDTDSNNETTRKNCQDLCLQYDPAGSGECIQWQQYCY